MVRPINEPDEPRPDHAHEAELLLRMNGFDDCIIGLCHRAGAPDVIAYDVKRVLRRLRDDGMTHEEAREFFEFNQLGAYMGPMTPVFVDTEVTLEEMEEM